MTDRNFSPDEVEALIPKLTSIVDQLRDAHAEVDASRKGMQAQQQHLEMAGGGVLDRAQWREVKAPVLVMANRQDPIHPFEFGEILAREISQAEFRELTSKSVSKERYADDVQRYLTEFLKKHFEPDQCSR